MTWRWQNFRLTDSELPPHLFNWPQRWPHICVHSAFFPPIRLSRPCLTPSLFPSASPADFPWQQRQQRAQKERVGAPLLRTIRPHPAVGVAWTHYPANGAAGLRRVELLPLSFSPSPLYTSLIPSSLYHACTASLLATEGTIATPPCTAGDPCHSSWQRMKLKPTAWRI